MVVLISCFMFDASFISSFIGFVCMYIYTQANFVKWKAATIVCFFVMCLTWLATRLYILPFVILRSILMEGRLIMEFTFVTPEAFLFAHGMFVALVGLLVLLHVAWFFMFMKMLAMLVARKECHDLSEHKHGEQQHGHQVYQ